MQLWSPVAAEWSKFTSGQIQNGRGLDCAQNGYTVTTQSQIVRFFWKLVYGCNIWVLEVCAMVEISSDSFTALRFVQATHRAI